MPRVLIAGESWITHSTHVKGVDSFTTSDYHEGVGPLRDALEAGGWQVDYLPNHMALGHFPADLAALQVYQAVILSDIGANTLLLHPDTFNRSIRTPNRLETLTQYVLQGGGLLMIGGYMTFAGIDGKGAWAKTSVGALLPVVLQTCDDRVETPQGMVPEVEQSGHDVLAGVASPWPFFLGYNQAAAHPSAQVLMTIGAGDPFLAVREVGSGRTAAFASDCAPHWGPPEFQAWSHHDRFWDQLLRWVGQA